MELTSLLFLLFVLASCLVYYLVPRKAQWVILLASSLVFYVSSCGVLIVYLIAASAIVFLGALWLDRKARDFEARGKELDKAARKEAKKKHKKSQQFRAAAIAIAALSILAVLKYSALGLELAGLAAGLFHRRLALTGFRFALPLGISYYTLMAVSYVTDVYRGKIRAEKNPLRVLLFLSYYPHITEGPFDRYKELNEQFSSPHSFDYDAFCNGLILILYGYLKKMVIADRLGITVSEIFQNSAQYSGSAIAVASVLYTIQLYCDFSGCIDIVSGVSSLYGIQLAENFRQPFFSKSIQEFWRRWHITLGTWLKEYVYYPVILSGHFKKVDKFAKTHLKSQTLIDLVPAAYSLLFVWFSNGLWHGASVHFILYGLYYYVLMMLGELMKPLAQRLNEKRPFLSSRPYAVFQVLRTLLIVNTGMLLFRSASMAEFFSLLGRILRSFPDPAGAAAVFYVSKSIVFALFAFLIVVIISILKERQPSLSIRERIGRRPVFKYLLILALICYILTFGIYGPGYDAADFLYAQF